MAFRHDSEHHRSVDDAGKSIVREIVWLRQQKPTASGAKRRWAATREDGGAGQGAAVPCPASAHRIPKRDERFGRILNC